MVTVKVPRPGQPHPGTGVRPGAGGSAEGKAVGDSFTTTDNGDGTYTTVFSDGSTQTDYADKSQPPTRMAADGITPMEPVYVSNVAEPPPPTGGEGGEGEGEGEGEGGDGTLDEQVEEALQPIEDEINAEAAALAAETGDPQPIVEVRSSTGVHTAPVGYIGEDGQPIPVTSQNDTVHQKSINVPDQPSPTGLETPAGTFSVGGVSYAGVSVPNGGGVEYFPTVKGSEKDGPLFHNIPGTPAGHICLTDKGREVFQGEGLIEGDAVGESNGIPYFKLSKKFEENLKPSAKPAPKPKPRPGQLPVQNRPSDRRPPLGSASQLPADKDRDPRRDKRPVDPGYGQPAPTRPGAHPDNSLPKPERPVDPGYGVQAPPARPDQSLPSGRPDRPDQSLPGSQPRPDQGLPPTPPPRPDQSLPPTASTKPVPPDQPTSGQLPFIPSPEPTPPPTPTQQYQGQNSQVMQNPDGTTTESFHDGRRVTTNLDGSKTTQYPDGRVTHGG